MIEIAYGAMRLAPRDFWNMTPFEFHAAWDGWRESRGSRKDDVGPPTTRAEFEEMVRRFPDGPTDPEILRQLEKSRDHG